ncbi:hypothetical protein VTN02DRAFT_4874 [Thermoascus thermophilus]
MFAGPSSSSSSQNAKPRRVHTHESVRRAAGAHGAAAAGRRDGRRPRDSRGALGRARHIRHAGRGVGIGGRGGDMGGEEGKEEKEEKEKKKRSRMDDIKGGEKRLTVLAVFRLARQRSLPGLPCLHPDPCDPPPFRTPRAVKQLRSKRRSGRSVCVLFDGRDMPHPRPREQPCFIRRSSYAGVLISSGAPARPISSIKHQAVQEAGPRGEGREKKKEEDS